MTREEAIKILKGAIKKPNTKDGYLGQAVTMAIRSLEAWDKVTEEITEYLEEYGDTDASGNHSAKWCAMKEADAVVKKHMNEVTKNEIL